MPAAVGVMADSYNKPAGGGWTPANLGAALQLWLDASDAATITHSAGAVSQWNDKSGNARHYVQTVAASKPITGSRTIGGLNALDCDGVNDYMIPAAGWTLPLPYSIVVVGQTDVSDYTGRFFAIAATTRYVGLITTGSGLWNANAGGGVSSVLTADTVNAHVLTFTFDSTAVVFRLDGVVDNTGTPATVAIATTHALFATNTGTTALDGACGELVITNTTLSGTDLTNLESYLKTKWGTP